MTAKYKCIVADPPWPFGDKLPGKGRGAEKNYAVMSVEQICGIGQRKVDHLAMCGKRFVIAADALLFLWRVNSMPQEALDVVSAWGFEIKSEITWVKLTQTWDEKTIRLEGALPGGKLHFGMGRYVRMCDEKCFIAARGRATQLIKNHSTRSVFFAPVPRNAKGKIIHSAKPPEFYTLVEKLCEGPRLELFAREGRAGWTTAGDEIGVIKTPRNDGVGETFAEMVGMSNGGSDG